MIESLSTIQLLQRYVEVMEELKRRQILRSANNPVADFAEYLTTKCLSLQLCKGSTPGYDAVGQDGTRYQIKARRHTRVGTRNRLSAMRNFESQPFDVLVIVLFDVGFRVASAHTVPYAVVQQYAAYNSHQNGHILLARGDIFKAPGVEDLTERFRAVTS